MNNIYWKGYDDCAFNRGDNQHEYTEPLQQEEYVNGWNDFLISRNYTDRKTLIEKQVFKKTN